MIELRKSNNDDLPFLKIMLYEAVYWSDKKGRPTFEEAFNLPFVKLVLENWGKHIGDLAVIASIDQKPVGAAWIRYFTEDKNTRGYIRETIPVLVIGISNAYRHQGIGAMLIKSLNTFAKEDGVSQISLCVSKQNYAQQLYIQQGFKVYQDIGDSLLMLISLGNNDEV